MQAAEEPLAFRRVVLYGDSLAWLSQKFFMAGPGRHEPRHQPHVRGTTICDWLVQMRADAKVIHPDAVVVDFSGNALTPRMNTADGRPLSGPAYSEKYAADAAAVLDIFTPGHSIVFFAGAPIGRYTDAGAAVLSGGRWTETLSCRPAKPCTGGRGTTGTPVNVVRAPDGVHFCPGTPPAVHGVTAWWPVWASGAWRFGNAMAAPVIAELSADR